MANAKCPVCKNTNERIQCVYVPLGHGRFCEYFCCDCWIIFPWGANKFGDIFDTNLIKKVQEVEYPAEGKNEIDPKEHSDYKEDIFCLDCKKDITHSGRSGNKDGWKCQPRCK